MSDLGLQIVCLSISFVAFVFAIKLQLEAGAYGSKRKPLYDKKP